MICVSQKLSVFFMHFCSLWSLLHSRLDEKLLSQRLRHLDDAKVHAHTVSDHGRRPPVSICDKHFLVLICLSMSRASPLLISPFRSMHVDVSCVLPVCCVCEFTGQTEEDDDG